VVVNPAGGKYVSLVAPEIAATYPSADERQEYVMVLSPPLAAVVLPMVVAGVPPLQIDSPVLDIVPVVYAGRTVREDDVCTVVPPEIRVTAPVVAFAGTVTVIEVALLTVNDVPETPLNWTSVTITNPEVEIKPLPVIVIGKPAQAVVGLNDEIVETVT
jgi:hypothetical protein